MTHPVGEKLPNAFGLHDMYGNVWEWCWDWLGKYPASLTIDPTGPATGTCRLLRGNGWYNGTYQETRPSFRLAYLPGVTSPNHDFGFRVAAGGNDGLPVLTPKVNGQTPPAKSPVPPTVAPQRAPASVLRPKRVNHDRTGGGVATDRPDSLRWNEYRSAMELITARGSSPITFVDGPQVKESLVCSDIDLSRESP